MLHIIGLAFAFIIVILIVAVIIKKVSGKKKLTPELKEKFNEVMDDHEEFKDMQKSATEMVKSFIWVINSPESPYNRQQRRRIKRHWKKFVWAWPELTKKQQDFQKIVGYLVSSKHNKFVVYGYQDIVSGSFKEGEE